MVCEPFASCGFLDGDDVEPRVVGGREPRRLELECDENSACNKIITANDDMLQHTLAERKPG